MGSGLDGDTTMESMEHIQTQSTIQINGMPLQKSIEEGPEDEERDYDLTLKMNGAANDVNVELSGLKSTEIKVFQCIMKHVRRKNLL